MKEKIDLFAKGIFSYDRPELCSSVGSISISVEMGKVFEGSFSLTSSDGSSFKGIVYSSDPVLGFESSTFIGSDNTVRYSFDATHLDINDSVKGRIFIVSSLGELEIPFHARVRVPACDTSIGPASDLFHFASLAQTDWSEAKNLFKSEEFARTLSFYDSKYDNLLRTLLRSGNTSLALEELLVATHKKKAVEIRCNKREISYENSNEVFTDTLILTKDSWGFLLLTTEAVGDFLTIERKIIWSDDFNGNTFILTFTVDPAKLHAGTNLGKIIISSITQRIEIPVIVKNAPKELKERLAHRKIKHIESKLLSNYLDYRRSTFTLNKFLGEEAKYLDNIAVYRKESLYDRYLRIYMAIESGRDAQAITALSVIFEDEEWGDDTLAYAIALYLMARIEHDNESFNLSEKIRDIYENCHDGRIYVLYMSLDKRNRLSLRTRYNALRNSTGGGQNSPIVLLESALIVNEDPSVLKEFDGFDLLVARYGIRFKLFNKNALLHIAYLATKEKTTTRLMLLTLINAAESFKTVETLEALCMHLIRAEIRNETAFKWLSVGVNEQLDVKYIYESCLFAAGDRPEAPLPKAVMTYFEGDCQLPDETKAMYFANLLRFDPNLETTSPLIYRQIVDFGLRMISEERISLNLADIYNLAIKVQNITPDLLTALPGVVFKTRVRVPWSSAKEVLIVHKELDKEAVYPVEGDCAWVDVFTDNCEAFVQDEHGNRIVLDETKLAKLVTNQELIKFCLENCSDDDRVLLAALENARYRGDSDKALELVKKVVHLNNLEKRFELECKKELIEYYYDNLEGDLMEDLLVSLDLSLLTRHERVRMIDLMILRELYSLAVSNMEMYGSYGVDVKRIAKLATRMIETNDNRVGTALFTSLCFMTFKKKRYEKPIIEYLVRFFNGNIEEMNQLLTVALDMGVPADDLEERILSQILFTESDVNFAGDLFRRYYDHGGNRKLIRAFLTYYAYGFLVREHVPQDSMLELMRRESLYEQNDLCMLACLKYLSTNRELSDQDKDFVAFQLANMEQKGVVMPFFKFFEGTVPIPESMRDKQYVEYHTDPKRKVKIHYCLSSGGDDDTYIDADMKDLGYGIFVSEFVVFYDEVLQYYITEEDGANYSITESNEIKLDPEMIDEEENGYHQLNLIITSKEMNDCKTMQKLLETYVRNEYMSKRLFNPIVD